MTKYLEIRRHSVRNSNEANLNQVGVALARAQGAAMGPYARVITSPAARAIQTAVAMGFAVNFDDDMLAIPDDMALAIELDACRTYANITALLRGGAHMPAYGRALRAFAVERVSELADGDALLCVSHGGVVETLIAACLDAPDHVATFGAGVGFCEGARLAFDGVRWSLERLARLESPRA